jgi:predicted class III extradiol MEMO1 family dioxygenase
MVVVSAASLTTQLIFLTVVFKGKRKIVPVRK